MERIKLGNTGLEVTPVCFGAWEIGGEPFFSTPDKGTVNRVLGAVLDAGINFIDTAPVYGFGRSEELLGEFLGTRRKEIVLATKCGITWDKPELGGIKTINSREVIRRDVENSLRRLRTDCVDVLQVHWPEKNGGTPISETIETLEELKEEGKCRFYGVSNFSRGLLEETLPHGKVSTLQNRFSIVYRDRQEAEFEFCREHGVSFLAYSPLHRGLLTDNFQADLNASENWAVRDIGSENDYETAREKAGKLYEIAREHDTSLASLALNFTIRHTRVDVAIVGSKNPAHVRELAGVLEFDIKPEDAKRINGIIK
jgi:aryl-alcohol dehydrogenase-like predicted oxidoreductase